MQLPTPVNRPSHDDADVSGPMRPARRTSPRRWVRDELGVVLVLIVLVIAVGWSHPAFLHSNNLLTTVQNSSYVGLMACGMVFALAMREVDLSVGGIYALGIVVGAQLITKGVNPWVAALVVLLLGALLGVLNGVVTTYIQVPSFISAGDGLVALGIGTAQQWFDLCAMVGHQEWIDEAPLSIPEQAKRRAPVFRDKRAEKDNASRYLVRRAMRLDVSQRPPPSFCTSP